MAFPDLVADGGRFIVEYQRDDGTAATVEAALAAAVSRAGDIFTIRRPGFAALLATTPSGDVVDIKHVRAKPVVQIVLLSDFATIQTIEIDVGEVLPLTALPVDDLDAVLAGALQYEWTLDDPALAKTDDKPGDNAAALEGLAPGTTTLRVRTGMVEHAIPVSVVRGGSGDTDIGTTEGGTAGTTSTTGTTGGAT